MADGRSASPPRRELRAAKRELLAALLKEQGVDLDSAQKIYPRQSHDNLPLSFAQERLWFLDQLAPGNSVYNICRAHRLTGPPNLTVLTLSLNEVVRRHEVLRTAFPAVDGRPIQVVKAALPLTVKVIDLHEIVSTAGEADLLRVGTE
jgi:Condensation domain